MTLFQHRSARKKSFYEFINKDNNGHYKKAYVSIAKAIL